MAGMTYAGEGDGTNKSVKKSSRSGRYLERTHALGTHLVADNLGRINGLHWSETTGKHSAKHKDKDNTDGRSRIIVIVRVSSSATSNNSEANRHTSCGSHEHLSAPDDIVKTGTDDGGDPSDDGIHNIEDQLGVRVRYADTAQHDWQIVGYNAKNNVSFFRLLAVAQFYYLLVPAELSEPRESNVEHQSIPTGASFHKDAKIKQILPRSQMISFESRNHLIHLKVNKRMIRVTIRMVGGDDVFSLCMTILGDQPG
jgi:hypothetical protein